MSKKRIGVVGCGQWGPNLIRNFYFNPEAEVIRICDMDTGRLNYLKSIYPNVETTQKYEDITTAGDIDAVVICTPTITHHEIAKNALLNGKDVLCEKPLTIKTSDAEDLVKTAKEKNLILMVGHVFLFNPGILKLKEYIKFNDCGDTCYMYSQRTNLGTIRKDVNVVYDLASHDISIFNFLFESSPKVVSAVGKCVLQPNIEEIAFISLEYGDGIFVHIHVSWLDPKKVREITLVGSKKMVTWNDLMERPIEVYSKHIEREPYYQDYGEFRLVAKEGEVLIPHIKNMEPLKLQVEHFINCIKDRKKPVSDGESGIKVVKVLEDIENILSKSRARNKLLV